MKPQQPIGPPEVLLTSRRFEVVRYRVPRRDGSLAERDVVLHPGAVVILPMVDDEHVCLIRNFRIAVGETLIELPAGTLEPHEDPAECARRELIEETGYRCGQLRKLHAFNMSPGVLRERMHLFLATDLTPGEMELEPGEEIESEVVAWHEALAMAEDGRIQDAKTLVGLMLYDRLRG